MRYMRGDQGTFLLFPFGHTSRSIMKQFLMRGAVALSVLALSFVACQDDDPNNGSGGSNGSTNPTTTNSAQGGSGGAGTGGTGSGANTGSEICDDGIDNDGDNFIDCIDYDCRPGPSCLENTDALCSDGEDNDGDMLMDCADPSCHGHPNVTVCVETNCDPNDGNDDDMDGFTDCADEDCFLDAACAGENEVGNTDCDDNADNDNDGPVDCQEYSCRVTADVCTETGNECTGGMDEDGDMFADCADRDCQYDLQCPNAEVTDALCSDGINNDASMTNTYTDCEDFSCQQSPLVMSACEGNAVTCSDGIDNDGEGNIDCEDFACRCCGGNEDACVTSNPFAVDTCAPCP